MIKRLIGIVRNNEDPENMKRVQASIIGFTDSIPDDKLCWAFPLDSQCIVPYIDKKVWIFVESEQEGEGFNYSKLYYSYMTEETYKECYDITDSTSHSVRKSNKRDDEPDDVSSVEYPKNRVIKYSDITIEFDEGNKRFCITDEQGNYLKFYPDGIIERCIKNKYLGVDNLLTIDTNDGTHIKSGSGTLEKMLLGETLDTWLGNLTTWLSQHVHSTPAGPSGPPVAPLPTKPNILSNNNKNN